MMVLGFNHNIRYKGELFHVQTEDSGRANPHIITLLYRGGTILASMKTSYADIIKVEQLEAVVESLMKDQHKAMMRRLKAGEFDARIFTGAAPASEAHGSDAAGAPSPARQDAAPTGDSTASQPAKDTGGGGTTADAPVRSPLPASPLRGEGKVTSTTPAPTHPPSSPTKRSLDEVILDYLITGEEK